MKTRNIFALIGISLAMVVGTVGILGLSKSEIKTQEAVATDVTLTKDRTIIVAYNDGLNIFNSCTVALFYTNDLTGDSAVSGTVEVTRIGTTQTGYATIPSGAKRVEVMRLAPGHQALPCDGWPTGTIYNQWMSLNLQDNKSVFAITGYDDLDNGKSKQRWFSDVDFLVLPSGMPVFVKVPSGTGWLNDNPTLKIYHTVSAAYGVTAGSGLIQMTRMSSTSEYFYCVPQSTVIANHFQIQRFVNGSWCNETSYIQTSYGYYNTTIVDIEDSKNDYSQNNWDSGKTTLDTANAYGEYFLNTVTCSGNGSITSAASAWTTVKNMYDGLSKNVQGEVWKATANESGSLIQQAMARYDYIVGTKKYSGYNNFVNRSIAGANQLLSVVSSDNTGTIVVVTVSLVAITSVGAYFFLKRRKEVA